jgi:hypothetical protein
MAAAEILLHMVKRRQCPAPATLRPMMHVTAAVQISLDDDGCTVSGDRHGVHTLSSGSSSAKENTAASLGVVDLPTKMVLRRRIGGGGAPAGGGGHSMAGGSAGQGGEAEQG